MALLLGIIGCVAGARRFFNNGAVWGKRGDLLVYGCLALGLFFFSAVRRESGREIADTVFFLYLVFIMGEGIARESLTFLGCLPLFVATGFRLAPRLNRSHRVRAPRREEALV